MGGTLHANFSNYVLDSNSLQLSVAFLQRGKTLVKPIEACRARAYGNVLPEYNISDIGRIFFFQRKVKVKF